MSDRPWYVGESHPPQTLIHQAQVGRSSPSDRKKASGNPGEGKSRPPGEKNRETGARRTKIAEAKIAEVKIAEVKIADKLCTVYCVKIRKGLPRNPLPPRRDTVLHMYSAVMTFIVHLEGWKHGFLLGKAEFAGGG